MRHRSVRGELSNLLLQLDEVFGLLLKLLLCQLTGFIDVVKPRYLSIVLSLVHDLDRGL